MKSFVLGSKKGDLITIKPTGFFFFLLLILAIRGMVNFGVTLILLSYEVVFLEKQQVRNTEGIAGMKISNWFSSRWKESST